MIGCMDVVWDVYTFGYVWILGILVLDIIYYISILHIWVEYIHFIIKIDEWIPIFLYISSIYKIML